MLNQNPNIWAIVPSAGKGERMGEAIPKQYLELLGRSIIEHSVTTLLAEGSITQVVVCVADGDQFWDKLDCARLPRVSSTNGGNTRAQSVLNGILSISEKAHDNDWVLVHDAARPCLSQSTLASFIEQLFSDKVGGILALPSNDTVKLSSKSSSANIIEKTLDRQRIWYAQTPQMFRFGKIKQALEQAIEKGETVTDEASAIEMAGYKPRLIEGEVRNIKITRIDDLDMASLILSQSDDDLVK